MERHAIVVLKFGSSVLGSVDAFPAVVHEIYRHVRQGERVVAVVSAMDGQTEGLLADACALSEDPDLSMLALLLGMGEQRSALLLTLALERAGLRAVLLSPADIALTANGDALDADPDGLDVTALRASLREAEVAVVPGFIGLDASGRTVLLGRGGSDLTALFLAERLGHAPCRLLKDVNGIYEADPALTQRALRRFAQVTWTDARAVAGQLVQAKAIAFAEQKRLPFKVAGLGATEATRVGAGPTRPLAAPAPERRLRVALLGAGTVGYGVYRHLAADPRRFEIVGVAVSELGKPRRSDLPRKLLTDDPWALLGRPSDLVIELIGGEEPAHALIAAALEAGRHVVTANKTVIARTGPTLESLAGQHGCRLAYSASVGGGLAALELVRCAAAAGHIRALEGVLNGTCNFLLDRLAAGDPFAAALAEAQQRGFAEADPSLDISGRDAASKLRILVRAAFGVDLAEADVGVQGIADLSAEDLADRRARGETMRLVADCLRWGETVRAKVAPQVLRSRHWLANVSGEWNRLRIVLDGGDEFITSGKGAGRWPTAEAVFADVMDIYREVQQVERRIALTRSRLRLSANPAA